MDETARILQIFSTLAIAVLVAIIVGYTHVMDFWGYITVGLLAAVTTYGLSVLLEVVSNHFANRNYHHEMRVFDAEAKDLGYEVEDIETAKYAIRGYLVNNPAASTSDIFDNVELPAVFTDTAQSVAAFRLGGLIGVCRYGQDPATGEWYAIRDSALVAKQYRRFQRYIKSGTYRKGLLFKQS